MHTAAQGYINPDPADTAAAPDKKPLQRDLISYLGVSLWSPLTICLLRIKLIKAQVQPERKVLRYAYSEAFLAC